MQSKGEDTACEIKLLIVPIIYTYKDGLALKSNNDSAIGGKLLDFGGLMEHQR